VVHAISINLAIGNSSGNTIHWCTFIGVSDVSLIVSNVITNSNLDVNITLFYHIQGIIIVFPTIAFIMFTNRKSLQSMSLKIK